ncbi:M1 family aminopeptidase [Hymenobacter seoulensis]
MFLPIFLFELKYRFRRPATWIYFGLFLLMAFLLVTAAGGGLPGSSVSIGGNANVKLNAPHTISTMISVLSWIGVLVASALMSNSVYRDFEHKTHSLFFTTPISKWGYLGGRFLGSFVVAIVVFTGIGLGIWLATLMPWIKPEKLGPTQLSHYVWPYLIMVLPNLLFSGAVFFTMATLTRNILSTYIGSVVLLLGYIVAQSYLSDMDNEVLASSLDAFGAGAIYFTTRYWTPAEKNTLLLPLSKYILLNRGVWLGVALALLALCFARFRFSAFASEAKPGKRKAASLAAAAAQAAAMPAPTQLQLPKVAQLFTSAMSWRQWWSLTKMEFRGIVRSVYFIALVASGAIYLLVIGTQVGKMYGTTVFPVTNEIMDALGGNFALFMLIIITYYSGELVWRERESNISQITDSLPVPNWVPFFSKLTALGLIQVVLLLVVLVCGVLIQTAHGYFQYEPLLYLKGLFGGRLPDYLLLCVLAMLVQVLVNNKYVGHFVMVLYYVANIFRGQLGLNHHLLDYGGNPDIPYSAMNGYGHFVQGFVWFKVYWAAFAVLLAVLSNLLWVRGTEASLSWRRQEAGRRFRRPAWVAAGLGLLVILVSGGFIFYNTNVLNDYRTPKAEEQMQAAFEKKYRRYLNAPQPRITAVNLNTDIFPEARRVNFTGYFVLQNKTSRPLDSVHVTIPQDAHIQKLDFGPGATLVLNDSAYLYRIYRLGQPLAPGDSLRLNLEVAYEEKGFPNSGSNTSIVYNGTFFNSSYLPSLGYSENRELSDDDVRKRNDLQPKPRMARVNDLKARQNTYISHDSDWIRFETTVSTSPDQVAVAPGYLQKEWTTDGRRYFHYKMDRPMLNFYSFLSARYAVKKDKWVDSVGQRTIPIEIYYHPGHEYNLDRMMKGVKESLSYFSRNFSPYQHRQVRILEFPQYASFAQSFANTIPFSESIGFIADVDDKNPDDIDYPFYVTSHEVAHQWWAHQVIGGDVQGSTLMSETLSQYAALMVMKHHYGAHTMQKFLKYELNSYLGGRSSERKKEVPLAQVENQPYIHYRKGSVVMYALADYIGEAKLNAALKEYTKAVAYQGPPFTNSTEFLGYIKRATPDSLQYLVKDMFENITLYDNRMTAATAQKLPNGQYKVKMTIESRKFYADSLGNERDAKYQDWVPVAVFPEQGKEKMPVLPLAMTKRRLHAGTNYLEFIVPKKPAKAGVDPYHMLVDRTLEDNTKAVEL